MKRCALPQVALKQSVYRNFDIFFVAEKVIAVHNFEAEGDDELSLKKGDIVVVMKKIDEGWWVGSLNGQMGMFPANYVEHYDPDSTPPPVSRPSINGKSSTGCNNGSVVGDKKSPKNEEQEESPVASVPAPGFSYLPRLQPGEDLSTYRKATKTPAKQASPVTAPVVECVGPCGDCGCDDFVANVFKPRSCNNCFHIHQQS